MVLRLPSRSQLAWSRGAGNTNRCRSGRQIFGDSQPTRSVPTRSGPRLVSLGACSLRSLGGGLYHSCPALQPKVASFWTQLTHTFLIPSRTRGPPQTGRKRLPRTADRYCRTMLGRFWLSRLGCGIGWAHSRSPKQGQHANSKSILLYLPTNNYAPCGTKHEPKWVPDKARLGAEVLLNCCDRFVA